MDQQSITISHDGISFSVALRGAELVSLKRNGKEFIWMGDPSSWNGHAPILFPVCGGVQNGECIYEGKRYPMMKHGFLRFMDFEVESFQNDGVSLVFSANELSLQHFPFHFSFRASYRIEGQLLQILYEVLNQDERVMHFGLGSHEGYFLADPIQNYFLEFEQEEHLVSTVLEGPLLGRGHRDFGTRTRFALRYEDYENDALVFPNIRSKEVRLMHRGKGTIASIRFQEAKHLVLWTLPDAQFVCIEPWNSLHDKVDFQGDISTKPDMVALPPNGTYRFWHSIALG